MSSKAKIAQTTEAAEGPTLDLRTEQQEKQGIERSLRRERSMEIRRGQDHRTAEGQEEAATREEGETEQIDRSVSQSASASYQITGNISVGALMWQVFADIENDDYLRRSLNSLRDRFLRELEAQRRSGARDLDIYSLVAPHEREYLDLLLSPIFQLSQRKYITGSLREIDIPVIHHRVNITTGYQMRAQGVREGVGAPTSQAMLPTPVERRQLVSSHVNDRPWDPGSFNSIVAYRLDNLALMPEQRALDTPAIKKVMEGWVMYGILGARTYDFLQTAAGKLAQAGARVAADGNDIYLVDTENAYEIVRTAVFLAGKDLGQEWRKEVTEQLRGVQTCTIPSAFSVMKDANQVKMQCGQFIVDFNNRTVTRGGQTWWGVEGASGKTASLQVVTGSSWQISQNQLHSSVVRESQTVTDRTSTEVAHTEGTSATMRRSSSVGRDSSQSDSSSSSAGMTVTPIQ